MISLADYQRVCDERDDLLEQVAYLREELGYASSAEEAAAFRALFGQPMRPAAARLLQRLYRANGEFVALNKLNAALPDLESGYCVERVKVHVRNIRMALGDGAIETTCLKRVRDFTAYRLTREGLAKVEAALIKREEREAA